MQVIDCLPKTKYCAPLKLIYALSRLYVGLMKLRFSHVNANILSVGLKQRKHKIGTKRK